MNQVGFAVIAILMLMLAGCVSETSQSNRAESKAKQVQSLVDLGVGYLRNGEYARAKENLTRALEINPNSPLAHNTLALVFQLEQEYEAAEDHFKIAIKTDPKFTRARNNYGAFLFERGRYRDAIVQLEQASEDRFYAGRSTVFENLGVAHTRLGNSAEAERAFERSVALNPEQPRALLELGLIRLEQQRFVESRELYRRHARVAPQSARGLFLCVRVSRVFKDNNEEASCALALKNVFPGSNEYKKYRELVSK
ncbi:MAG: type IV pilus biogenesis/stability protein PilW [Pseudomonadales bacterium]